MFDYRTRHMAEGGGEAKGRCEWEGMAVHVVYAGYLLEVICSMLT